MRHPVTIIGALVALLVGVFLVSKFTVDVVNEPANLMRNVQDRIERSQNDQLFLATVTAVTDNTVTFQRTGHDPDVAEYAVLDNFPYPKVGDEVMVAKVGSGNIVVGHVLRDGLSENYLKIETVLTIEAGGRIEDADGSIWDQDGITLQATGSLTDTITLARTGFEPTGTLQGSIDTGTSEVRLASLAAGVDEARGAIRLQAIDDRPAGGQVGFAALELDLPDTGGGETYQAKIYPEPEAAVAEAAFMIFQAFAAGPPFPRSVNFRMNTTALADVGSGEGVFALANALTNPSSNPTNGGVLYSNAGALTWRGSGGTTTVIAVA